MRRKPATKAPAGGEDEVAACLVFYFVEEAVVPRYASRDCILTRRTPRRNDVRMGLLVPTRL